MTHSTIITAVFAIFTMAVSCTKKYSEDIDQPITVNASFAEKTESKSAVVDGGNVLYWEDGDAIKFFYRSADSKLSCSTASLAANAAFTGTYHGQIMFGNNDIHALYPYSEEATCSDGIITAALSSAQTAREGSFDKDLNICVAHGSNLLMKFYSACSGIRFSVLRQDVTSVTLEGSGGEILAGKLQISFRDGIPQIKNINNPQKKIVLSAPKGECFTPGVWYYIICAPKSLTKGYKLTFDTGEKYAELENTASVVMERNCFVSLEAADRGLTYVPHGEKPGSDFESAAAAVSNMKVGWNCGNQFDSHGVACEYNTKYRCGGDKVLGFETGWNNPKIQPQLFPFVKAAGFGAIRLPVTWYPFMDNDGNVDEKWMNRVEEVVNYILDADMYCIINVHHDAGSKDTRWLTADPATYEAVSKRFKHLWAQIATRFQNYGPKLLFEGYNEILDASCNWDATDADSYATANQLNQDFVDVVRGTGGNNRYRNLVVTTYSASAHKAPCQSFKLPSDVVSGHLIAQVHNYSPYRFAFDQEDPAQDQKVFDADGESQVKNYMKIVNDNIVAKGIPCILGEFGARPKDNDPERAKQAKCYVSTAKQYGIVCFIWNTLINGDDRTVPQWTAPLVKNAMLDEGSSDIPAYYSSHIAERTAKVGALQADQKDGFIFWTDTHMADNTRHSSSLIESVLAVTKSPKVFWGGDAVPAYTDNVEKWWSAQAEANAKIMQSARLYNCHGNHDLTCQLSSTSATGYTLPKSQVRSLFQSAMSPVIWSNAESDALYYYFDETASGIRYIVLDSFDEFGDKDTPRAVYQSVNSTQMDWIFKEAVMKAPAGAGLVFIMHCNAAFGVSNVYKALGALARHENYNGYNFSTRTDLKLLFTLGGHYHHDMQIVTDGVFHIQSECDARYSQGFIRNPFADSSIVRDSGTINEQAFDYVSLSKDASTLTMVRIGHGGCRLFNLNPVVIKAGNTQQLSSSGASSWYCYDSSSTYASGAWTLTNNVATVSTSGMISAKAAGEAVAVAMDKSHNVELFYIKVV